MPVINSSVFSSDMEAVVEGLGDVRRFPAYCRHQAPSEWPQSDGTERITFVFSYYVYNRCLPVPADTLNDHVLNRPLEGDRVNDINASVLRLRQKCYKKKS